MIVLKTTNGEQGKCNCLFGTEPAECIKSIPFTLIKKKLKPTNMVKASSLPLRGSRITLELLQSLIPKDLLFGLYDDFLEDSTCKAVFH